MSNESTGKSQEPIAVTSAPQAESAPTAQQAADSAAEEVLRKIFEITNINTRQKVAAIIANHYQAAIDAAMASAISDALAAQEKYYEGLLSALRAENQGLRGEISTLTANATVANLETSQLRAQLAWRDADLSKALQENLNH